MAGKLTVLRGFYLRTAVFTRTVTRSPLLGGL